MKRLLRKQLRENEIAYLKMVKETYKDLIKINDTFTNAEIDLIELGHNSYDGFLWQREILAEYKLFITYYNNN